MIEKLKAMIGRCIIAAVSDQTKTQSLQIEAFSGDLHDEVERFQQFGFSGVPMPNAEGIVLFVAGNHDHPVVIAAENRDVRVNNLTQGESAMYNGFGHKIVLYQDRCEIITPRFVVNAENEAVIKSPKIKLDGEVEGTKSIYAEQEMSDGVGSMSAMRGTFNGHDHDDTTSGGQTAKPNQLM